MPAYQTARGAIRSGPDRRYYAITCVPKTLRTRSQTFIDGPWVARMDISNGTLGEGLDFDKARYLSEEFLTVIIKQDDDAVVDGDRSMHLAELSGGILAQFCFSITVGEDRFS